MLCEWTLKMLCNKYKILSREFINDENNILDVKEYTSIDKILNFLINDLKIDSNDIVKYPDIIFSNISHIKWNYDFLITNNIKINNIKNYLCILSLNSKNLFYNFNYLILKYSFNNICDNILILAVPNNIILDVEQLNIQDENQCFKIAIGIFRGVTTIEKVQDEFNKSKTNKVKKNTKEKIVEISLENEEPKVKKEGKIKNKTANNTNDKLKTITLNKKNYKVTEEQYIEINKILKSDEYKNYPELFSKKLILNLKFKDFQNIINSKEYLMYSNIITAKVIENSSFEDVQYLLNMDIWKKEEYKKLLTSNMLMNASEMISKIPIYISVAKQYGIEKYLSSSFFVNSPRYNDALIKYLLANNIPLIENGRLNILFSKKVGTLKTLYHIDLDKIITKEITEKAKSYKKVK